MVTSLLATPGILTQSAEHIAEAGYRGLMRGQRTVMPGLANKLVTILIRLFPRRLLLRICSNLHQIYQRLEQAAEAVRLQRYLVALAR